MINLLPPDIKQQIRFSYFNTVLRRYIVVIVIVAGAMSAILVGGNWFARQQIEDLARSNQTVQQEIEALKEPLNQVQTFADKLNLVGELFERESHYSQFMAELSSVVPAWAQLTSLRLERTPLKPAAPQTPEEVQAQSQQQNDQQSADTPPAAAIPPEDLLLELTFVVPSETHTAILRETLATLPRFEFVDIVLTSRNSDGNSFSANYVIKLAAPAYQLYEPEGGNSP